jgi:hypothetical protein
MMGTRWDAVEDVGDQSEYVGQLLVEMAQLLFRVRSLLATAHFRFLCDKLVMAFVHRYQATHLRVLPAVARPACL